MNILNNEENLQERLDQIRKEILDHIPSKVEEIDPHRFKVSFIDTTEYIYTTITPTISSRISKDGLAHGRLIVEW